MAKYLDVFLEESREHIKNLNRQLLELEKNSHQDFALKEIFRSAHTLKGMSSTMGFDKMAELAHYMENLLADLKEGKLLADSRVVDVLFECIDRLQIMIDSIAQGNQPLAPNNELIKSMENIRAGQGETAAAATPAATAVPAVAQIPAPVNLPATEPSLPLPSLDLNEYEVNILKMAAQQGFDLLYVEIGVAPDSVMKTVRAFMVFKILAERGEIIKSYPTAAELDEGKYDDHFAVIYVTRGDWRAGLNKIKQITEVQLRYYCHLEVDPAAHEADLSSAETTAAPAATASPAPAAAGETAAPAQMPPTPRPTIRVDIARLDKLMNLVGELVTHKGHLEQVGSAHKLQGLSSIVEELNRNTDELQSVVMKMRMVPIEQVFNRFPRMIRDLAKELNKDIEFIIVGAETELDRTVIDEISEPLLHLLRNAVDHGIESPQERIQQGKPAQGKLYLRARHEGNNVFIEVEDDGRGINTAQVRERAFKKGLISRTEAEKMSEQELNLLIFAPGFSTAAAITDISGRGVGLDVVRSRLEGMNGEIIAHSQLGQGSLFKIKLPLTLAIIQALMVTVQHETYALPLTCVDETTMIRPQDIKNIQGQEFISLRGNILPLLRLAQLLELPKKDCNKEDMYVVVLHKGGLQVGLVVDTLIGQREIVIKSLGKILNNVPGIAGAIISSEGNVCLILDIATLF